MTTLQSIGVDKSTARELEFVSYKDALIRWGIYKLDPSDTEISTDGNPLKNLPGNDNEKQLLKNSENNVYVELADYDDSLEFAIDEHASCCSNGIITTENDQEIDVKIDLEGFNINFQVCNDTLAIFGSGKDFDINSSSHTSDLSTSTFKTGRRYKSFCHPIRLPPNASVDKVFSTFIDEKMHIKVPKNGANIIEETLAAGFCAICKWKECLT